MGSYSGFHKKERNRLKSKSRKTFFFYLFLIIFLFLAIELTYGFAADLNILASPQWIGGLLLELSSVFLSAYSTFNLATKSIDMSWLRSEKKFPPLAYLVLQRLKPKITPYVLLLSWKLTGFFLFWKAYKLWN